MNDRIGQLAEQAGLLGPSSRIGESHDATERFAELIVRECGNVAYKAYWDSPEKVRGIHFKEKIAQHFGVEL